MRKYVVAVSSGALSLPGMASSMRMTKEKVDRLPNLFAQIVYHDREIGEVCSAPIVSMKRFESMLERRFELKQHVERLWFKGNRGGKQTA